MRQYERWSLVALAKSLQALVPDGPVNVVQRAQEQAHEIQAAYEQLVNPARLVN